jgi:hypothetical protein
MPAITRKDGEQFAVYTYRELLTLKKTALLKQEIELLRQEHGQYARFYWQEDGDIEAVFSRDAGYLLAESVWEALDKPDDLLYCEVVAKQNVALLVVIRAGSVYLDAEIGVESLQDEFQSLISSEHQYDIYIYGDVPLAKIAKPGMFAFDETQVKSFTVLEKSVFLNLPLNDDYRLLPVSKAIDDLKLREISFAPLVLGVIALGVIGYFGYQELKPVPPPPPPPAVVNPYAQYEQKLMSPEPSALLSAVAGNLRLLFTIPGWAPTMVTYEKNSMTAVLASELKASGDLLLHWIKHRNMVLGIQQGGMATIQVNISAPGRPRPTKLYNLKEMLSDLFDHTHLLLPGSTLTITTPVKQGVYQSSDVTVNINEVSAAVLAIYGETLNNKPIILNSMNLQVETGLISGQIQLTVLGA